VLFLGNSYTSVNDLPRTLAKLSGSVGQADCLRRSDGTR